jgi:hypothetical protein
MLLAAGKYIDPGLYDEIRQHEAGEVFVVVRESSQRCTIPLVSRRLLNLENVEQRASNIYKGLPLKYFNGACHQRKDLRALNLRVLTDY